MPEVKVFAFDIFGTVVDWRSSIAREAAESGAGGGGALRHRQEAKSPAEG